MQTVIALALILASGWNTNGQDGIVTISDPAGDENGDQRIMRFVPLLQ